MINNSQVGDIVSEYRRRVWILFATVSIVIFLPSSVLIFVNGHRGLAIAVVCMLTILAVNAYTIKQNKEPQITMTIFVASLMLAIGLSLIERGVFGVFWTYPAILFINFLAFGWRARVYTAVFFFVVSSIMLVRLDLEIAARAVVGLVVTILFTYIFLGMIDKLQKKLVEQSSRDPLTGALNRREMDSILQEAVERKRRSKTPASLLVIDVDEFKSVNDTYGHAKGDYVLKELVTLIRSRARVLDRLFRMGGEEFLLFLPDTAGDGAVVLAEEFRSIVFDTEFIKGRRITVSIGITELEHGENIDEWIKRGDDAMFTAKFNGRNQAVEGVLVPVSSRLAALQPV